MVYWKDESTDDQFVRLFVFDRIQFESIKLKCLLAVIDEIGLVDWCWLVEWPPCQWGSMLRCPMAHQCTMNWAIVSWLIGLVQFALPFEFRVYNGFARHPLIQFWDRRVAKLGAKAGTPSRKAWLKRDWCKRDRRLQSPGSHIRLASLSARLWLWHPFFTGTEPGFIFTDIQQIYSLQMGRHGGSDTRERTFRNPFKIRKARNSQVSRHLKSITQIHQALSSIKHFNLIFWGYDMFSANVWCFGIAWAPNPTMSRHIPKRQHFRRSGVVLKFGLTFHSIYFHICHCFSRLSSFSTMLAIKIATM